MQRTENCGGWMESFLYDMRYLISVYVSESATTKRCGWMKVKIYRPFVHGCRTNVGYIMLYKYCKYRMEKVRSDGWYVEYINSRKVLFNLFLFEFVFRKMNKKSFFFCWTLSWWSQVVCHASASCIRILILIKANLETSFDVFYY